MRKILLILIIGVCSCFKPNHLEDKLRGSYMPRFSMSLMEGNRRFSSEKLRNGKHVVLFYFSPNCQFCRAQTESILSNITAFENVQFCLLTASPIVETRSFYEQYKLGKYKNILVGQDSSAIVLRYFKIETVPFIAIYDNELKLKQRITGNIESVVIQNIIDN